LVARTPILWLSQAASNAAQSTVEVERLKSFYAREDQPAPLDPVCNPGQEEEYEVEQLLTRNRKQIRGRKHYLMRWRDMLL
jgi:hypothetical protein